MYSAAIISIICIYSIQFTFAASQGDVRMKLDSIQNPFDFTLIDKCCRGVGHQTSGCSKSCTLYALICLTAGLEDHRWSCSMESRVARIFDNGLIDFDVNETLVDFKKFDIKHLKEVSEDEKGEHTFLFRIQNNNRDETHFRILVRFIYLPENDGAVTISEFVNVISFKPHGVWRENTTINHYGPNLKYRINVRCDDEWGSDSCSYQCVPTNHLAHFDCDENKRRICHAGWTGEVCTLPICNVCQHGWCVDPYECWCESGWEGPGCDKCSKRKGCLHGTCENPFDCNCIDGWTGENCDQRLTCNMNPCVNEGICLMNDNVSYSCLCPDGLSGKLCEKDIKDHCKPFPCTHKDAVCTDKPLGYECTCPLGWTGVNCTDIDSCSLNPCANAHRCVNIDDSYYCYCKHGWSGKNCTQNSNDCKGQCQNDALCVDQVNGYSCICKPGYSGKDCEIDVNECASSPCKNQGVCKHGINKYECVCQSGFSGMNCTTYIDYCQNNPCLNGGSCTTHNNDYTCHCTKDWTGRNCDLPSNNVDVICKNNLCQHGSTCYVQSEQEKCSCFDGFKGRFCQIDIDDCLSNPCLNSGTCVDRVNSFECVCTSGYEGENCENNINECEGLPCQNGGVCIDGINSYTCDCPSGYRGHDCSYNIDDCQDVICFNDGTCSDEINGYVCNCKKGFLGKHCELRSNQCLVQSCVHGKCLEQDGGYACMCDLGYVGEFCDEEINECIGVICQNGGSCIDKIGHYECSCSNAFYGLQCEYGDACRSDVCGEYGECIRQGDGYQCQCRSGYFGINCERTKKGCMLIVFNLSLQREVLVPTSECGEHGRCVSFEQDSWRCLCDSGWTGHHCNVEYDECESGPCKNGALCIDKLNDFECKCPPGYFGKDCSKKENDCHDPCPSNKICKNVNGFSGCFCRDGETEPHCKDDFQEQSCVYHNHSYKNGSVWMSECNRCRCENGEPSCNSVDCGALNCFKQKYRNCTCREVYKVDCITPPCTRWGECVTFKTASMMMGGCRPTIYDPNLNENCSTLNILFEKARLPTGILVQEICKEFRYSDVLQTLQSDQITLACQRFTHDANLNELVVSVYTKKRSMDAAILLANHLRFTANKDSVLQILNRTVTKLYVKTSSDVQYNSKELNILLPLIGGLILVSILVLLSTCVFFKIRRRHRSRYKEESFFTQQQNFFGIDGKFKTFECEPNKKNIKASMQQQSSKNKKINSLTISKDNEYLPDKLYLSEPGNKFPHC